MIKIFLNSYPLNLIFITINKKLHKKFEILNNKKIISNNINKFWWNKKT